MKPVNINQLLIHPKMDTLSFFMMPFSDLKHHSEIDLLIEKMVSELVVLEKVLLQNLLLKSHQVIKKIMKEHPHKSFGFFISKDLLGYLAIENKTDFYHVVGQSFYFRPVLEELFVNPYFILVNVSLYDIKIYRGDFQYIEITELFEFDQVTKSTVMTDLVVCCPALQ